MTRRDGSSHRVASVFWQGLRKHFRDGARSVHQLALAVCSNALIAPRTTCRHGHCAGIFATRFWALHPNQLGPQGIRKERVHA